MTWTVRRIRADEVAVLRETRLRALADAAPVFGSTLAEARLRTDTDWASRARENALSQDRATFAAVEAGRWVGMVGAFTVEAPPLVVQLGAMWVDPDVRGRGLGQALVDAVVEWARRRGASRVRLGVTEANVRGRALYERAGFVVTGRTEPLRSDPTQIVLEMERPMTACE